MSKRIFLFALICILMMQALPSCEGPEKVITVVVREQGSGTREAFDRTVTNGEHFLEERDENGKKRYYTVKTAVQQTKTGSVISTVMSDVNAIGYISLGAVSDLVKLIRVNGYFPDEQSVLSGEYPLARPYVIMTNANVTLAERVADFLSYLRSDEAREHSLAAGCVFLSDPALRAGTGNMPQEVVKYEKKAEIPNGERIVIRGSTSVEKFITSAAKSYADIYSVRAEDIFDIQLEGTSVGRKAVEEDRDGRVIGLSSAYISQDNIDSFNVCLDAVVVIVNKANGISNLSLAELFNIFSGSITKFSQIDQG